MYTEHAHGLGQTPEPSLWETALENITKGVNVVAKAVTAGMDIKSRISNLQAATAQRKSTEQLAQQVSSMYTAPQATTTPTQQSPFGGWGIPLMLGGAVVLGVLILRK